MHGGTGDNTFTGKGNDIIDASEGHDSTFLLDGGSFNITVGSGANAFTFRAATVEPTRISQLSADDSFKFINKCRKNKRIANLTQVLNTEALDGPWLVEFDGCVLKICEEDGQGEQGTCTEFTKACDQC